MVIIIYVISRYVRTMLNVRCMYMFNQQKEKLSILSYSVTRQDITVSYLGLELTERKIIIMRKSPESLYPPPPLSDEFLRTHMVLACCPFFLYSLG